MRGARTSEKRWRGQGLVEFALILPLILLIIFFIIEMARLLHAYMAIENGARFGVRYAATGEYNPTYCVDGADVGTIACDVQSESDAARIPSIKDVARAGSASILRDESVAQGQPGFFKVTVCSNKAGFVYYPADVNASIPADCQPTEDGGDPGGRVSVTVDFDHPLIAPILSSWWPTLHLTARREAIVEQFRLARVLALPATMAVPPTPTPTLTPSHTPTVTDTPTLTFTPTDTLTPTDTFTPTPTRTQTVTPSLTLTPTTTPSPTLTPTPSCALITFIGGSFPRYNQVSFSFRNGNPVPISLTYANLAWTKAYGTQYVDFFNFAGNRFYNGNDSTPPTGAAAPSIVLGAGATASFLVQFGNVPSGQGLDGDFTATLTFDGICDVSGSQSRTAPTATSTRTPTNTFTPSNTPTRTNTPTITFTPSRTFTATITLTPSSTFTPSRTPTRTATYTGTATYTPSRTPTASRTPTPSRTPSSTSTPSSTFTPSRTPTVSSTPSRTPTPTRTPTRTPTPTVNTPTPTRTGSPTPTPTEPCYEC